MCQNRMLSVIAVVLEPLLVGIVPTVSDSYATCAVGDRREGRRIWADLLWNPSAWEVGSVPSAQTRARKPVLVERPPHQGGNGGSFGGRTLHSAVAMDALLRIASTRGSRESVTRPVDERQNV